MHVQCLTYKVDMGHQSGQREGQIPTPTPKIDNSVCRGRCGLRCVARGARVMRRRRRKHLIQEQVEALNLHPLAESSRFSSS